MTLSPLFALLIATVVTGCSLFSPPPVAGQVSHQEPSPLDFALASGIYRCESGLQLQVARNPVSPERMQIHWNGREHALVRDHSASGLPRYHEPAGNLVWIDLPWKGILLDGRTHKPIASECSPASA